MMSTHSLTDNKTRAALLILLAIGLATTQDAIVKSMSSIYPVYETMIIRGLTSTPILAVWLWRMHGFPKLVTPLWPRILLRGLILCSAYLAFVLSIAAMPMANAVAIYFTMPFFVGGLAGPLLGERVPLYRWIAIVTGFVGVIIMVRPGIEAFEPASLLALYSAFGYAVGQMMGRHLAQKVEPLVIANWQNAIYVVVSILIGIAVLATDVTGASHKSLAFLTRPFAWPTPQHFLALFAIGILAAFTMMSFISAYKLAESNFVAPFEYSGMVWAVAFGFIFFNDFPDAWTWGGMAIVAGAGLFMLAMDRRAKPQSP